MLAKAGGDARGVSSKLSLLRESFKNELGSEGSGAFESAKSVEKFFKAFAKHNGLKVRQLMFPTRVALTVSVNGELSCSCFVEFGLAC